MREKRAIFRLIVLGVMAIALGSAFFTAYFKSDFPVRIGDAAPDFTLITLEGERVRLSELKGQGVFINFWATWCTPCRREMPHMERQYQEMKEQGVEILAVNIAESNLVVSRFTERLGLTFPILLDSDRAVTERYGVGALPASFFVDKDGVVVAHYVGEMNERIIIEHVDLIRP